MKILLLMTYNGYHGREYMNALIKSNVRFDVISINQDSKCNEIEDMRTNYMWKPEKLENIINRADNHYIFKSLDDENFYKQLQKSQYDIGIQGGGLGILKERIINTFKQGCLNLHPGDLPAYRGSSAPEWQLFEGNKIVATCHLIDNGIDTGDIIEKKKIELDYSNYYSMRSRIYPEMASFLVEIIQKIILNKGIKFLTVQDEDNSVYRKYIGDHVIEDLKKMLEKGTFS